MLTQHSHEVIVIASPDSTVSDLESLGAKFIPLRINKRGKNPFKDLILILRLLLLFISTRPDVFLGFTIKPNLYGGLVSRLLKIPHIHNISGMGDVFINENVLSVFVRFLYRMALKKSDCVFFQNKENLLYFRQHKMIEGERVENVIGSGIDIKKFAPITNRRNVDLKGPMKFLMAGRLIREKGVKEYVDAAIKLRIRGLKAEFTLMGSLDDSKNKSYVSEDELKNWDYMGIVNYVGFHEDVRDVIHSHDCVVLPSYYSEGVPKILLEAAGMGKPVITTDMPGCRDAVLDGVTGYLCKPQNVDDLVRKMKNMVELEIASFERMGVEARNKAVQEFDEKSIIEKYLSCIGNL